MSGKRILACIPPLFQHAKGELFPTAFQKRLLRAASESLEMLHYTINWEWPGKEKNRRIPTSIQEETSYHPQTSEHF